MKQDEFLPPDLSDISTDDLAYLMIECGLSRDKSDQMFAKACRDEIAKRKIIPNQQKESK